MGLWKATLRGMEEGTVSFPEKNSVDTHNASHWFAFLCGICSGVGGGGESEHLCHFLLFAILFCDVLALG